MSQTSRKRSMASSAARAEEGVRQAEAVRARRSRFLTLTSVALVVTGLISLGAVNYARDNQENKERRAAGARKHVRGEQTWNTGKLGYKHVKGTVAYPMNPPVGGNHSQDWMDCDGDIYDKPIRNENAVHSLEHGAVWITYNNKADDADIKALAEKVTKTPYTLMSPVNDQHGTITLSAWGHQLRVSTAHDSRIEEFISTYVQGPQTPEPGAACTNGLAAP
jgi:hypothetical protein